MPRLNRDRIRDWLLDKDKSVRWLAEQADIPHGALANALCPSADQMRAGRVRILSRITGIPEAELVAEEKKNGEDDGPKEETTAPPRRDDSTKGPKRARGATAA